MSLKRKADDSRKEGTKCELNWWQQIFAGCTRGVGLSPGTADLIYDYLFQLPNGFINTVDVDTLPPWFSVQMSFISTGEKPLYACRFNELLVGTRTTRCFEHKDRVHGHLSNDSVRCIRVMVIPLERNFGSCDFAFVASTDLPNADPGSRTFGYLSSLAGSYYLTVRSHIWPDAQAAVKFVDHMKEHNNELAWPRCNTECVKQNPSADF